MVHYLYYWASIYPKVPLLNSLLIIHLLKDPLFCPVLLKSTLFGFKHHFVQEATVEQSLLWPFLGENVEFNNLVPEKLQKGEIKIV